MSSKPKIRKLLSVGNRRNQSTQISRYFSQEHNEHINGEPNTSGNAEKRKRNHLSEGSDGLSMEKDIGNCSHNNQNKQTNTHRDINEKTNKTTRKQRKNTITNFFNISGSDNDFETPKKEIKKAPIKRITQKKVPVTKKPRKVKSTLHKTEEIFSEIIAQHGIEENVNPMDLQIALALSKSEVEINKSSTNPSTGTNEGCSNGVINSIGIKEKLQQYGFTATGNHKDYDVSLYMTGRRKVNWANKFTPLTLRNEQRQSKKLEERITLILEERVIKTCNIYSEDKFTLNSDILKKFKPEVGISNFHCKENSKPSDYYVSELFTPTKVKIGFLLKDHRKIPGRDQSPVSMENSNDEEKPTETIVSKVPAQVAASTTDLHQQNDCCNLIDREYLGESPKLQVSEVHSPDSNVCTAPDSRQCEHSLDFEHTVNVIDAKSRALSPDLFEEYEDFSIQEHDVGEKLHISGERKGKFYSCETNEFELNSSNIQENSKIILYDQYSTDEVKINESSCRKDSSTPNYKTQPLESCIDLTADSDSQGSSKNQSNSMLGLLETDKNSVGLSQISNTDDGCVIISDDEVNYSVTMTTTKKKYMKTDNCSDENICDRNKLDMFSNQNLSFIDILGENFDDGNISEELSDSESPLKSRSSNYLSSSSKSGAKRSLSFRDALKSDHKLSRSRKFEQKFGTRAESSDFDHSEGDDISTNANLSAHYWSQPDKSLRHINKECFDKTTKYEYESKILSECLVEDMREPKLVKRVSNTKSATYRKSLSESYFMQPTAKRTSAWEHDSYFTTKFKCNDDNDEIDFSDLDEIDKLVYGSQTVKRNLKKPSNLDNLITGNMNDATTKLPEKYKHEGKVYTIRTENIPPKPDYTRMDSPTRLKELYKYGIKPLKKEHAIKMLEFIYDQTHPRIIKDEASVSENEIQCSNNKSYSLDFFNEQKINSNANIKFTDCFGGPLLLEDETVADVKDEDFIFQTNIRSKISTAHVPLHLAWYNLVKSNGTLREALLHYEPIDLQQVYLYFQNMGLRYDPKDIKRFFDKRCILFRYDLSNGMNNRIRKKKNTFSQNT